MLSLALLFSVACSTTSVEGRVTDRTNAPIAGASVSTPSEGCEAISAADGGFRIECPPGQWRLNTSREGYLSHSQELSVVDGERVSLPPIALVAVPSETGLYALIDDEFKALQPAILNRATDQNGVAKRRRFCVNRETERATTAAAGKLSVLEQGTVGWRMFRMDNDGCAYRDAKTREGHWVVEHQQQPEVDSAALNKSATMHQLSLDPGHYFVAHWAGFFAPTEGNPEAYTGHWIHLTD